MDKQHAADAIIEHALPIVAFEGWNQVSLNQAALNAGYKKTDVIRVFPGGTIDAVEHFFLMSDSAMEDAIKGYSLDTMKIRERIATAIRLRLLVHEKHREGLRKAIALQSLPIYAHRALKNLYRTVDAIWNAVGDNSTDFNFYTKRLTLAAVYSSTLIFWLDDKTPGQSQTWEFLDRRIANVMQIEKFKSQLKGWFGKL